MTAKRKFQIVIDMMMAVMLPLLMAYQLIGEALHKWMGSCMLLLFLTHHLLNSHWHKNILKGSYNRLRMLGTAIDILLFIIMISLAISGVSMSKHIFTYLHAGGGSARIVHLLASYWGFVLMSIHMGLHGHMASAMINRILHKDVSTVKMCKLLKIVPVTVCSYGAYAFIKQHLGTYLFLKSEFVFFDFSKPLFMFFVDYIAIIILFAFIGKQLGVLCKIRRKHT